MRVRQHLFEYFVRILVRVFLSEWPIVLLGTLSQHFAEVSCGCDPSICTSTHHPFFVIPAAHHDPGP